MQHRHFSIRRTIRHDEVPSAVPGGESTVTKGGYTYFWQVVEGDQRPCHSGTYESKEVCRDALNWLKANFADLEWMEIHEDFPSSA